MGPMDDMTGFFGGGGDPAGVPNMMNPGGGPQQASGDPIAYGLNVCISSLKKLAQDAALRGDETTGNVVDAMAIKLVKIKLNRQKAIDGAAEKGALTVASHQL